jgi:Mn2+/Fe2+ NRAMP family transporter
MKSLKYIGPGIVVAATGIGAGDMITAALSGAKYGFVIIWAAVIGAVLKYFLNEGIARWQLATGTSVLEGWNQRFPPAVSLYFIVYLFIWGFIVAGALISACGLAAHAIMPFFPVRLWGIIHSLIALLLVYLGRYKLIEKLMKFFIALMFIVVVLSAILVQPEWGEIVKSLFLPKIPKGSAKFIIGVIGGVGGSVTLLSYGYWIREKKWIGEKFSKRIKIDLLVAYILTGLFGMAIMIISAGVKAEIMSGSKMVIGLAERLGSIIGTTGKWIFLLGFWGAVFSSMIGVWQGVPYLFTDSVKAYKRRDKKMPETKIDISSWQYVFFLLYLSIPPQVLLFFGKPVWIVVIYTIIGAFFMPFLAVLLLIMNNRIKWVRDFKNNLVINVILLVALILFLILSIKEISQIIA